ncbi:MAG: M23 family metallopeptidase [Cyclobacteriaceae bacterium]|nr:M23 family metallopeptidase [Cyclobacteriaceae bacterium]
MFILVSFHASSQSNYYQFPIKPGQRNYLAGTMGELRGAHFHGGIDIKTEQREGLDVHAAADGYISRIKFSTSGYGNCLYIQHPNGETTVYAHLQKVTGELGDWIREQQYKNKTFEIELFPERNQFQVKKGEVIALSGNSGSSGGPHLHFEIRDRNQHALNPLNYNFKEIVDNIPPQVQKIALVPLCKESRVNHQHRRQEFYLYKGKDGYYIPQEIEVFGRIGIEIKAYDMLDGAPNRNGVPLIEMRADDELKFSTYIDVVPFAYTRDILIHTNYSVDASGGGKFVRLYTSPNNRLSFYTQDENGGIIEVYDDRTKGISIKLSDVYENESKVNFQLKGTLPAPRVEGSFEEISEVDYQLKDKVLKFWVKPEANTTVASVSANRMRYQLPPAYLVGDHAVYLWGLERGVPERIVVGDKTIKPTISAMIPCCRAFTWYSEHFDISFPADALYDTLYMVTNYDSRGSMNREEFIIHKDVVPLKKNISILLKPSQLYTQKSRTRAYRIGAYGRKTYKGGEWQGNHFRLSTRSFGRFVLLPDTVPPTIVPLTVSENSLRFRIDDDLSGINTYNLYIDGEWVLMNYDYKTRMIWSEKRNPSDRFRGDLKLRVTDKVGNVKVYERKI